MNVKSSDVKGPKKKKKFNDLLFFTLNVHTLLVWITFRDALVHFLSLFPPVL